MSEVQYAVRQGGMFVAKVECSGDEDRARAEGMHYLAMYAQDGPAELWRRSKHRRWKPLGIRLGVHPDTEAQLAIARHGVPCTPFDPTADDRG